MQSAGRIITPAITPQKCTKSLRALPKVRNNQGVILGILPNRNSNRA